MTTSEYSHVHQSFAWCHFFTPHSPKPKPNTAISMEFYSSLDASQLDSETPTLFELISAHQLESLLSPALRYILVHYTAKYPRHLLKINNRFDELNLGFRAFVEWYFIQYWQGSFTENFYGIKRVNETPLAAGGFNSGKLTQLSPGMVEERRGLTELQKFVSIFEVVGTLYVLEKLNYYYDLWYTKMITQQLEQLPLFSEEENRNIKWKRRFVEVFPYAQACYRIANFATTLAYLAGVSKAPSLLTFLFRINYARLNQHDYEKHEKGQKSRLRLDVNRVSPASVTELTWQIIKRNLTGPTGRVLKYILGTFFPVAIFALKFLEWWNSSGFSAKLHKNSGNVLDFSLPPPSTLTHALQKSRKLEKTKRTPVYRSGNLCPICKKPLTNPAIIETGYVFDYTCIYNYLENSHKIVADKIKLRKEGTDDDLYEAVLDAEDGNENEKELNALEEVAIDINKGGRCPISGRKLLGCKWNPLKEQWDITGLRRLVF